MGLEPTTATLATWRSTTELHPHGRGALLNTNYKDAPIDFKSENSPLPCHLSLPALASTPVSQSWPGGPPAASTRSAHLRRAATDKKDRYSAVKPDCPTVRPAARNDCCPKRRHRRPCAARQCCPPAPAGRAAASPLD